MRSVLILLLLALSAFAQGNADPTGKYSNKELGLTFSGVYGWEAFFPAGSGAWTTLARYSNVDMRAEVLLLARNNPYATTAALRDALKAEFKEGGDPTEVQPTYKEIELREATMKRGLKLPGFEVEGYVVKVEAAGKIREYYMQSRTYFGKNRLFRVYCTAKKSRKKRVKDLFDNATAGVTIKSGAEQVARGQAFRSQRGGYACLVPDGFLVELPSARSKTDVRFYNRRRTISVAMYGYRTSGDIIDLIDIMTDFYGDDLNMTQEETTALGGPAFRAEIKRKGKVTLLVGAVVNERVYRIHVTVEDDKLLEEARRILEKTEKSFKASS